MNSSQPEILVNDSLHRQMEISRSSEAYDDREYQEQIQSGSVDGSLQYFCMSDLVGLVTGLVQLRISSSPNQLSHHGD